MSKSKFEYVKKYEADDRLLPNAWIVIRIDGKGFHKFSEQHDFVKPNDKPALDLMNACASKVLNDYHDIVLAYGQSDEYSFVFRRDTDLYRRRSAKLMSNIVSLFAANYVFQWGEFFPEKKLTVAPSFDARSVLYPSNRNLRDYLSWRQADCHINNLYNTTFWALVQQGGLTPREATERLSGTFAADKNEILFSEFKTNYNEEPAQFKKGSVVYRKRVEVPCVDEKTGEQTGETKVRAKMFVEHCDLIGDTFWEENPHFLTPFKDDC